MSNWGDSMEPDAAGPLVGWIEVRRAWRGIDATAWQALVTSLPGLERAPALPARAGINPFTQQPMMFVAKPSFGHARVIDRGEVVGEMKLVSNGPWEIRVRGDRSRVRAIALDVARRLGGRFQEMP